MKEYKNIDRLFQEKFRDFEQNPPARVWSAIENVVVEKPKRDKQAVWLWLSGVAAGLAILFFINGTNFYTTTPTLNTTDKENNLINNQQLETEVANTTTKDNTLNHSNQKHQINNINVVNNMVATTTSKKLSELSKSNQIITNNTPSTLQIITATNFKEITKNIFQSSSPIIALTNNSITNSLLQNRITLKNALITEKTAQITSLIPDETITDNTNITTKNKSNKWIVSTVAAPVYLNSFDKNTSSIDPGFNNNIKQGTFSAAYGVQVAYQINNRFSLQSGVHVVDYGYKTYGVYVSPSGAVNQYSTINYNDNANLIDVSAVPMAQPNNLSNLNQQESKGDLTQIFGYIEIPVEAKYNLNKGNFGINLVGGFSTLLLNKNEIFIETEEFSNKIGEASNLNSLNFSGNIGLEFDYKLYKNVHFNLVPMFKVQTNTFEKNTNGFSPYAIGIYSGLNLRF